MIYSNKNQMANTKNPYQGDKVKCLCVCSAGLLRSPTIAKILTTKYNRNTRACGTSEEYALIPLSEALLFWADEIHVVKEQEDSVFQELCLLGYDRQVVVLDIPDVYPAFDDTLEEKINEIYYEIGYE